MYGSYATLLLHQDDGYLYLFGQVPNGLALARVPKGSVTDKSSYSYYSPLSSTYLATVPSNTSSLNVLPPGDTGSGDIFYSQHHGTYLHFYLSDLDSVFRVRYSLDGSLTKWSKDQVVYRSTAGTFMNYAGHAFPGYDPSGKTLVFGWTYLDGKGYQNRMAKIVWA